MRVEAYTDNYREQVINLVREFYDEALNEYSQTFNLDALYNAIEINKRHSFLLVVDGVCRGLIAGMEVRPPFNTDRVFHEMIWFVSKNYRRYGTFLLNRAIDTLKAEGFTSMILTLMHNSKTEKVGRLYARLGFVPMETHYIKSLGGNYAAH